MLYSILFVCVLLADQLSKLWITDVLRMYEVREVIPGFFNLVYVTNTGAAFSVLADIESPWRHYFFVAVSSIAVIAFTVAALKFCKSNKLYIPALALIAGGAAGNLIDRIRLGSVVDFLDFYAGGYHWPAFNIADSCICIGAGVIVLINILDKKEYSKD